MKKDKIRIGELTCSPHTIPEAVGEIQYLLTNRDAQPRVIHFLNAHVYVLASRDPELKRALESARMVVADGMAIVWCSALNERCNMTELFRAYLKSSSETRSCVLLGGTTNEVQTAAVQLGEQGHFQVEGILDGYHTPEAYRDLLGENRDVDFVLLGMGTPKSEQIAILAADMCPRAVIWHIGGGTIQFLAGTVREAPTFMRRMGLQWLFRLCVEPRRMWRRYIIGLPVFFWKAFTQTRSGSGRRE